MFNKHQKSEHSQIVFSKQTVEYAQFRSLRFASMMLYFVLLACSIVAIWFLYTRTYQTIGQVEALTALGTVVAEERVNTKAYESTLTLFTERAAKTEAVLTRHPFVVRAEVVDVPPTSATGSTSTQPTPIVSSTISTSESTPTEPIGESESDGNQIETSL